MRDLAQIYQNHHKQHLEKKALEKIELDQIIPSTRKYPFIGFDIEKQLGKDVLEIKDLSYTLDGVKLFENVSFVINRDDKVALFGDNDLAKTALLKILAGVLEQDTGTIKWGDKQSQSHIYQVIMNLIFNEKNQNLIEWLRQYSKEPAESYIRGFLGRMLFSGDQPLKEVKFLSGGEKMRCMYSKLMLSHANTLLIDSPTIHLDLEAIQSVNKGLEDFKGSLLVASHDHVLLQSVCNKVVEIGHKGSYSYEGRIDDYLSDLDLKQRRKSLYQ